MSQTDLTSTGSIHQEIRALSNAKFQGMCDVIIKAITSGIPVLIVAYDTEIDSAKNVVKELNDKVVPTHPNAYGLLRVVPATKHMPGISGYVSIKYEDLS